MPYDKTFLKDPNAVVPFTRDWSLWLETGDSITSSTWILPSGITEVSSTRDSTTATIVISGGTDGEAYEVTNRITTSNGYTDDRTFKIQVRER